MLLGTGFVFYLLYAKYWVLLVDCVYNHSLSAYDNGYLLYHQCKL
jgi:hypothetical protein